MKGWEDIGRCRCVVAAVLLAMRARVCVFVVRVFVLRGELLVCCCVLVDSLLCFVVAGL